jgi:hypothetical protein
MKKANISVGSKKNGKSDMKNRHITFIFVTRLWFFITAIYRITTTTS